MENLRIAQITAHFQPRQYGGFEYYLCEGLSKLGHKVCLVTSDRIAPRYSENRSSIGVGEETVGKYKVFRFRTLFELRSVPFVRITNFLSDLDFDVVHAHEIYQPISIESFYAAMKKEKPYGFTQHRSYCPKNAQGSFLKLFYRSLGKKIIDSCAFVCATSTSAVEFLRNLGVKRRIEKLPNCLDTEKFRPNIRTNLKEKLGLQNHRLILFAGRLHREKGLRYLIRAFRLIRDRYSDTKLIIAGRGPERENLEHQVAALNLHNNVVFLDYFPYEKMPELYNVCDIFVLPSVVEPFGMALIEAMSCGKPAIGSRVGGINDIIENSKNGFLTEPRNLGQLAEKIEILLSDEKLRIKFGRNGREKAQNTFSYGAVAQKATRIYEKALEASMRISI